MFNVVEPYPTTKLIIPKSLLLYRNRSTRAYSSLVCVFVVPWCSQEGAMVVDGFGL
jgi:hypothetical protein